MNISHKLKKLHPFDKKMFLQFSLGVFLFVGFLSSTYLVAMEQDNTSQAMSALGIVQVRPATSNGGTYFVAGQPSILNLQLNTFNTSIRGVQMVFTIQSTVLPSLTADQIVVPVESGLVPIFTNVTPIAGGFEVQLALRPAGSLSPTLVYTNNSFVNMVAISMLPSGPGSVDFTINPTLTTAIAADDTDALQTIPDFSVLISPVPTNTLVPTVTPIAPTTTAIPTSTVMPSATPTQTIKATVTPVPTRTKGKGGGSTSGNGNGKGPK